MLATAAVISVGLLVYILTLKSGARTDLRASGNVLTHGTTEVTNPSVDAGRVVKHRLPESVK